LNVGARDAEAGQVEMVDRLTRQKVQMPVSGLAERLGKELDAFQQRLFDRALKFQQDNTYELRTLDEVIAHFREKGGFAWAEWCGETDEEARIKDETGGVTIRVIDDESKASGKCLVCNRPAKYRVALAKAY
jgi:prolyl-tRNA synthetase